jgi:hypothetical protein
MRVWQELLYRFGYINRLPVLKFNLRQRRQIRLTGCMSYLRTRISGTKFVRTSLAATSFSDHVQIFCTTLKK